MIWGYVLLRGDAPTEAVGTMITRYACSLDAVELSTFGSSIMMNCSTSDLFSKAFCESERLAGRDETQDRIATNFEESSSQY